MRPCVDQIIYRTAEIMLISVTAQLAAAQQPSVADGRFKAAVDGLVASLDGKPTLPAGWQKATLVGVTSLSGSQHAMHVCRVQQPDGKSGYAILSERQEQLFPVMFSGVPAPERLLGSLSLEASYTPQTPPADLAVPAGIRMIAPVERPATPGLSRVSTSPIACSLASVLMYVQRRERLPLFVRGWGREEYLHEIARCLESSGDSQAATAVRDSIEHRPRADTGERLRRYVDDRKRAEREGGFLEYVQSTHPSGSRTQMAKIKDAAKRFDALSAIDRGFLTSRLFPQERHSSLVAEETDASSIEMLKSDGTVASLIIERRYLGNTDSTEAAIDLFCATRGLRVQCQKRAVHEVLAADLPCLLLGPDGQAMVLMAIGQGQSTRWGLVYVPETVVPFRKSMADLIVEKALQTRPAATQAPGAASRSPSEVRADLEKEIGITEQQREVPVVADPILGVPDPSLPTIPSTVALPEALGQGAHVVDLEACQAAWQALVLREWQLRDNWEFGPPR